MASSEAPLGYLADGVTPRKRRPKGSDSARRVRNAVEAAAGAAGPVTSQREVLERIRDEAAARVRDAEADLAKAEAELTKARQVLAAIEVGLTTAPKT